MLRRLSPLIVTPDGPAPPPVMTSSSCLSVVTEANPSNRPDCDGGVVVTMLPLMSAYHLYIQYEPFGMPTSDGAAYSSIAMGRGLMPRSFMIEATVATSPGIFDDLVSSCQAMMSGTVSVATAFSRNLRMSLMLSEKLGPWIGVVASSERTWRKVRVQTLSLIHT